VRVRPEGFVAIVVVGSTKPAVVLAGAFIVTFCGLAVPVSAPLKPLNRYPVLAEALTATTVPVLYHPLAGLTVPPATGLAAVVR
jgi:hypothetical protein